MTGCAWCFFLFSLFQLRQTISLCSVFFFSNFAIKCGDDISLSVFKETNKNNDFLLQVSKSIAKIFYFVSKTLWFYSHLFIIQYYFIFFFISACSKHAFEYFCIYLNWTARWKIGWYFFIVRYMNNSPGLTKKKKFCVFLS